MKRAKSKTLSSEVFERLKKHAVQTAQELLELRCARSESCVCAAQRTQIFAEAVVKASDSLESESLVRASDSLESESLPKASHLLKGESLHELLGPVYEHLLLFSVKSTQGDFCRLKVQTKTKKQTGSFYTSKDLAQFAVKECLSSLVVDEQGVPATAAVLQDLKIIDPSMGCGQFVSAALDFLAERLLHCDDSLVSNMVAARKAVASCLHGVDLDAGAVAVAKRIIALQCDDQSNEFAELLNQRLKVGDSLTGVLPGGDSDSEPGRFHWKEQFPHVFSGSNFGFDAVIGNPPWEIHKPNSREFFIQSDAEHYSLGKQDALNKQALMRVDLNLDSEWQAYQSKFKAFKLWISESGNFKLQGSADINAYKLFVELSMRLARAGGFVALIVPSSLYSDKGAADLRAAMLLENNWISICGFINSESMFDIHRSFKFCLFKLRKGGTTNEIQTRFNLKKIDDVESSRSVNVPMLTLTTCSPKWKSIPEICEERDLILLEKIARNSVTVETFVREQNVKYKREFDMTNDSHLFLPCDQAEEQGFIPDAAGRWIRGEEVALPLYEGRMIGQFDVAQKGWASGKGRQAVWIHTNDGKIRPQYLIRAADFKGQHDALKVGFLGVGSATNARSMIAACLGNYPCGNSVPTFSCDNAETLLFFAACLNSFVFDYVLRLRLAGNNLNYFILQDCYLPFHSLLSPNMVQIAARLSFNPNHHSPALNRVLSDESAGRITGDARVALLCQLNALVALAYGLDADDLNFILRECDLAKGSRSSNVKGFWRVDKELPPNQRQTVRTLRAFEALQKSGSTDLIASELMAQ